MYNILNYGADPTGTTDSTTAIQNAINDCTAQGGGEVLVPKGIYLAAGLVLSNHVNMVGELGARGAGGQQIYGSVIKNTTSTTNTISGNGVSPGLESVCSSLYGISFFVETDPTHVFLPNGTNNILIEKCSFGGGQHAIVTVGSVYDLRIKSNFIYNQSQTSFWKQAAGGTHIVVEQNYFSSGGSQAILFADGGGSNELNWNINENIFAGYGGAGIAVISASTYGVDVCNMVGNHFESNTGANSWCVYGLGSCWNVTGNVFMSTDKGIEANLTNSTIANNYYSGTPTFAVSLSGSTNVVFKQTTSDSVGIGSATKVGW